MGQASPGPKLLRQGGLVERGPAKQVYDAKMSYNTFEFKVTPAMAEQLPFPGGYTNAHWLLAATPELENDGKVLMAARLDNDTSTCLWTPAAASLMQRQSCCAVAAGT